MATRDELKAKLNLANTSGEATSGLLQSKDVPPPPAPLPLTALVLHPWDLTKGDFLLERGREFQASPWLGETQEQRAAALADFHAVAFQSLPVPNAECIDPRRLAYISQMLQLPDIQSLRHETRLNHLASDCVAPIFASQFIQWCEDTQMPPEEEEGDGEGASADSEEQPEEEPATEPGEGDSEGESDEESDDTDGDGSGEGDESEQDADSDAEGDGSGDEQSDEEGESEGSGDGEGSDSESDGDGSDVDSSGGEGDDLDTTMLPYQDNSAELANDKVQEVQSMMGALGMGPGGAAHKKDLDTQLATWERVRNDEQMKEIFMLMGSLKKLAIAKQRSKPARGMDDMVGITLDGDITKLLSSELAQLVDPVLELATMRRLVDKECLARKHMSKEPAGKGPIICVVDNSGSMNCRGKNSELLKIVMANALSLTMAFLAARQKRWCALIAFSGQNYGYRQLTGMKSEFHRMLVLKPGEWDVTAILDHMEDFLNGGSSHDIPIREMPDLYKIVGAPQGRTDVLFISDAICDPTQKELADFAEWKKEVNAHVTALIIDSESGKVDSVCDQVYQVPVISAARSEVGSILSL